MACHGACHGACHQSTKQGTNQKTKLALTSADGCCNSMMPKGAFGHHLGGLLMPFGWLLEGWRGPLFLQRLPSNIQITAFQQGPSGSFVMHFSWSRSRVLFLVFVFASGCLWVGLGHSLTCHGACHRTCHQSTNQKTNICSHLLIYFSSL